MNRCLSSAVLSLALIVSPSLQADSESSNIKEEPGILAKVTQAIYDHYIAIGITLGVASVLMQIFFDHPVAHQQKPKAPPETPPKKHPGDSPRQNMPPNYFSTGSAPLTAEEIVFLMLVLGAPPKNSQAAGQENAPAPIIFLMGPNNEEPKRL